MQVEGKVRMCLCLCVCVCDVMWKWALEVGVWAAYFKESDGADIVAFSQKVLEFWQLALFGCGWHRSCMNMKGCVEWERNGRVSDELRR